MRSRVDVQNAPDALGVTAGQVPLDGQDGTQVALAGKERVPSFRPVRQHPCSHPFPAPQTPGWNHRAQQPSPLPTRVPRSAETTVLGRHRPQCGSRGCQGLAFALAILPGMLVPMPLR